jgi:hypothetical protein
VGGWSGKWVASKLVGWVGGYTLLCMVSMLHGVAISFESARKDRQIDK